MQTCTNVLSFFFSVLFLSFFFSRCNNEVAKASSAKNNANTAEATALGLRNQATEAREVAQNNLDTSTARHRGSRAHRLMTGGGDTAQHAEAAAAVPRATASGADGGHAPDGPSAEDDAKAGKLAPLAGSGGGSSDGSSCGSGSASVAVETGSEGKSDGNSDDDGDGSSSSSSGEDPPGVKAAKAAPLVSGAAPSGSENQGSSQPTETSGNGSDGADVIESDSDDGATGGGGADDKAADAANTATGPPPGLVKKPTVDARDVFTPGDGPVDDEAWKGKAPIIKAKFSLKGLTVKMLTGPTTGAAVKKALQTSLAKALGVPAKTSVRILRLGGASRGDSSAGAAITLAVLVPSKRGASR
jgi:hypothetical protein